jgi:hypothetical protein
LKKSEKKEKTGDEEEVDHLKPEDGDNKDAKSAEENSEFYGEEEEQLLV